MNGSYMILLVVNSMRLLINLVTIKVGWQHAYYFQRSMAISTGFVAEMESLPINELPFLGYFLVIIVGQ